MDRRRLLAGFLALSAPSFVVTETCLSMPPRAEPHSDDPNGSGSRTAMVPLMQSSPVTSHADGQVIEKLDIEAMFGHGVTVLHRGVTVRNCRIRYAGGHGVYATDATGLVLQDLEIDHVGAPPSGEGPSQDRNCVNLESSPNTMITRVKASRGASNIYAVNSEGTRMRFLELRDARGPMPRGQNVQFNRSPNSILEDFSAENGPTSWTEDNVSVFQSDRCVVRRGLVSYNNSPSGDGVMIEGSFDCVVEDIDAVQQGNGAFAAVPVDETGCGGCTFRRCRTRQTYNTPRDGRAAPTSKGLSIYTLISPGAPKHNIIDCHYDALANPRNLIWDVRAVNAGWSFTRQAFTSRTPLRLVFGW
jgi:Right handed beta helix region